MVLATSLRPISGQQLTEIDTAFLRVPTPLHRNHDTIASSEHVASFLDGDTAFDEETTSSWRARLFFRFCTNRLNVLFHILLHLFIRYGGRIFRYEKIQDEGNRCTGEKRYNAGFPPVFFDQACLQLVDQSILKFLHDFLIQYFSLILLSISSA